MATQAFQNLVVGNIERVTALKKMEKKRKNTQQKLKNKIDREIPEANKVKRENFFIQLVFHCLVFCPELNI